MSKQYNVTQMENSWKFDKRWSGIKRPYTAHDVCKLRGTVVIEHSLARMGAERLWTLLKKEAYVNALGAQTGNQAVQMVEAGLLLAEDVDGIVARQAQRWPAP